MKKKELVCTITGYVLVGMTAIELWGGGEGTMPMYKVKFDHEPTKQEIQDAINDGGMGCQSYIGAVVRLDTLYTHGAKEYGDAQLVTFPHYTETEAMRVLMIGHPNADVSVWDLPEELTNKI